MEEKKGPLDGATQQTEPAAAEPAEAPCKKKMPLKAKVAIGVGCALVIAGIGCGVALSMQQPAETAQEPAAEQQQDQKQAAKIKVDLGDWDADGATALIVHVAGNGKDFYSMVDSKGECSLELEPGDYEVEFVPAIGKDGSLLQVKSKSKLAIGDSGASVSAKAVAKSAADVTKEEMTAAVEQISQAVKKGDSSLKGEAGRKLLESAKENAAANPNMDDAAKAEAESKADEAEKAADDAPAESGASSSSASGSTASNGGGSSSAGSGSGQAASAPASSGNSGGSSSGSSSSPSSSQPAQPAHVHNWVAVTEQRWHSNPVSVWVQDSAAYDEPVYEGVNWCTKCNCAVDITHTEQMMLQGVGGIP